MSDFDKVKQAAINATNGIPIEVKCPFICVKNEFYKIVQMPDRWNTDREILSWRKSQILQLHHSRDYLKTIPYYDDFIIVPDNKNHKKIYGNFYNLYSPFPFTSHLSEVTEKDFPETAKMLYHIFGEQLEIGLKYLKVLYEHPKQILPIFCLVSTERETGKTTFLNWIQQMFGRNTVPIAPTDLSSNFNSMYADKNIILIDETIIDKPTSGEKLKSIATQKTITVNQKQVAQFTIPFFGKFIICTNKERDFMRIDNEEIRFWVRKIKPIKKEIRNVAIEDDLKKEIPFFLRALEQLPPIDFSKSRMVFTKEELETTELLEVKKHSENWLLKDLQIHIEEYFDKTGFTSFYATVGDIKSKWFHGDRMASLNYIRQILKDDMKLFPEKVIKYTPFLECEGDFVREFTGRPYKFVTVTSSVTE